MTFGPPSNPDGPPGYQGYPPPERSPWSSPAVLVAIAAGVLLVVGGVLAAFLLIPSSEDDDSATGASVTPTTVTETAPPTVTTTVTQVPNTTGPPTAPTTRPTRPTSAPTVSGTDWQGFVAGPRCNASNDPAVAIGQTARSRVVICRVGEAGGLYYKGLADGNPIEVQFPTQQGDTFIAVNGATTYALSPAELVISQNGRVLTAEPMLAFWSE